MHAVVVSFDCLPVAWIGCYGNLSVRTPRLDAFASQSVVFDACYAADVSPGRLNSGWPVTERLRAAGVQCFSECDDAWHCARRHGARTLAWLQRAGVTVPGDNSQPAAAVRGQMERQVSELDAAFGKWQDDCGDVLNDDTLLIVTAAAGAVFVPHPNVARGCPAIVDPIVRVPLIVHARRNDQSGTRRGGLVSAADVEATLQEWLGIAGETAEGLSLLPMLRGEVEQVREAVCFRCEGIGRGVRTGRFTCLLPAETELPPTGAGWDFSDSRRPWLFAKPGDVWDMLDVAAQHPEEAARLVRSLGPST